MGLSPPQIALALHESLRVRIAPITIRRWTIHYCMRVEQYASTLNINAGFKWSTDEKYLKIHGKRHWLFAVMDVTFCHGMYPLQSTGITHVNYLQRPKTVQGTCP